MMRDRWNQADAGARLIRRPSALQCILLTVGLAAGGLPGMSALAQGIVPHDNPFLTEQAAEAQLPRLPKLPDAAHHGNPLPQLPPGPAVPSDVQVELIAINGHTVLLSVAASGRPQLRRVMDGGTFYIKGKKYRVGINGLNVRISRNKDIVWDLDLQGPPEVQR